MKSRHLLEPTIRSPILPKEVTVCVTRWRRGYPSRTQTSGPVDHADRADHRLLPGHDPPASRRGEVPSLWTPTRTTDQTGAVYPLPGAPAQGRCLERRRAPAGTESPGLYGRLHATEGLPAAPARSRLHR